MNTPGMTRPYWAGLKAACGLPAIGLFCALASFGALTEASGIELWVMIASVILIWSMPALMAFNEMMVTMSGVWAMIVAVAFANVRTRRSFARRHLWVSSQLQGIMRKAKS